MTKQSPHLGDCVIASFRSDVKEMIDQPKEIRQGEELDLQKLEVYLKEHLGGFEGGLEVKQISFRVF